MTIFFDICPNSLKSLYKDNENLKNQLNFNFLKSNVKGLQSTKKRLKLFNFLKNKIGPKGIPFLQETHSKQKRNGLTILKTKFITHMAKLIHVGY